MSAAALPIATSSLKVVFFLPPVLLSLPSARFTPSNDELLYRVSKELSSSPDDVPMVNMGPFFFFGIDPCACWYCADVFKMGVGWACTARCVCERYDEGAPDGLKPRTMLCVLISVLELSSETTRFSSVDCDASVSSIVDAKESIVDREASMCGVTFSSTSGEVWSRSNLFCGAL